jgi:conflict system STAND superfamily ATPase/TIR domain-containing protein
MTAPTTSTTHDLFISYAEADRAWVDGFLLDALDQATVDYHTEDAFALGVPRLIEFEHAIAQSKRTLLVLSPAYLADTFGQFVDVLVNSYGMETATWPVIPLILLPVDLPPRLRQLVPLDATNPETRQAALAKLCAQLQRPVPSAGPLPACPYPGMVPFDEADSERFFGREAEVQDLIERLRLHPFIAVIGASGSGKSSLVRAGLIPALRKSRLFGGKATQGQASEWTVKIIRPGATPLAVLAAAIDIEERLAARPEAPRLLLVVDQFEELFTIAGDQAQPFQQTLQKLAAAPGCYVVLTARADFYSNIMASPLWPEIQAHRMELMPITDDGLRRAIVQPAERVDVFVESALVERLLADAANEPGVLPLIQETLVLLWEKLERRFLPMRAYDALVLTRGAYADGGERTGLQVAIARRADATFASLTAEQQPIARRIFLRLIQFGEGRADTRRQQPVDELRSAGDDPALFEATLRHLTDSRLLTLSAVENKEQKTKNKEPGITEEQRTTDHGPRTTRMVDIAHEALIRGWPLLQGWLNERRDAEQIRRRLEDKAAEWVRLGRGDGGLLDAIEVVEAERWLESADADEMGFDEALPALAVYSRAALEAQEQEQEAARQRELAQAQALAEEQRQRAEQQRLRAEEQVAASRQLRQRAVFLAGALVIALVTTIAAVVFLLNSQQKTQEALFQKGIADSAKATAETSAALALAAEAQTRAQLLSVRGQREAAEQPLLGLRLALEGLTSVPDNAGGARAQLADAVVELARTGRVMRVSDDIQAIFKSPDGAHFVLARAQAPGELRRSSDGALLATLTSQIQSPSNVAAVSDVALAAQGVQFSPDASAATFIAYYADKNAELRRSADGKLLVTLQEQLPLVIFSSGQATYFVVVYTGYPAELRRSADGALIKQLDPEATAATFSTDSTASVFVIRYNDPKVAELRRSADGALLAQLTDSLSQDPIWSPDPAATYFVVNYGFLGVSDENGVELRRSADGKLLRALTASNGSIQFSKDSAATYAIFYTGESYELRRNSDGELVPLPDGATSVTISGDPARTYLVVDYDDKPTELRTIVGGALVQLPGKLYQTDYSPDPMGTYFVAFYADHPTEVRHTADGRLLATLKDQSGGVTFSPDPAASYFVVTYHSGLPSELHRSSDGALLATIPASEQSNSVQVQFPTTQAGVFALGYDGKPAELRRIADGSLIDELPDQQRTNNIIHFGIPTFDPDPSGAVFVVRYSGARAELRSGVDGALLGTFTGSVSGVTFSPSKDAKVFVLRYSDKPAELWDWSGKPRLLASLGFGADNYFFDPQGQHLMVLYSGGRAYLLDIAWLQAMQGELTQLPEAELIRLACQETRLGGVDDQAIAPYLDGQPPQACR